ncbi:MAG: hydrolase [Clostridiales bacterium]|nr:hydrolase [Clostridiales bacterium]
MKPFPRIGMRIIKSAAAVFLCLAVHLVRRDGMPFYSAIAAVLCMQSNVPQSVRVALNRVIGTLIGGVFGALVLLLEQRLIPREPPLYQYLLVSLCVIPLIYFTVLIRKPAAAYITCVVFMSITVAHGADGNPYLFALNRCLDTLIGIGVSLGVNAFRLPRRRNRQILFVVPLDALVSPDGRLVPGVGERLGRLAARGTNMAVVSDLSAEFSLLPEGPARGLPVLALGGAVRYDAVRREYTGGHALSAAALEEVGALLEREGIPVAVYTLVGGALYSYSTALEHPAVEWTESSHGPYSPCLVYGCPPRQCEALMVAAVMQQERAERLARQTAELFAPFRLNIRVRSFPQHEGDAFLEITSADAALPRAAEELKQETGAEYVRLYGQGTPDGEGLCGEALIHAVEQEFAGRRQRGKGGTPPAAPPR